METYLKQGLISDSKVLDIRQVDVRLSFPLIPTICRVHSSIQVVSAKILENELPVFVISFSTQEILLFRNAKSGAVVVGAEDRVEQCTYAAVITRVESELDDELTGGWKVVEVSLFIRKAVDNVT